MTEWFRLFTFAFISAGLLAVPILLLLMGDPSFFPKNAITALSVTFLAMSLIIIAVPDIVFDLGEGARKRKVRDYILSSFIVTTIVGIVVNFFTNWVTELPSYIVTPSGTAHSQSTEAPVSVSAFHLPDQMNEATNQDIRQSAYLLNQNDVPHKYQIILGGQVLTQFDEHNGSYWSDPFNFHIEGDSVCLAIRSVGFFLPHEDPTIPLAHVLRYVPPRYKLRPNLETVFE